MFGFAMANDDERAARRKLTKQQRAIDKATFPKVPSYDYGDYHGQCDDYCDDDCHYNSK